MWTHCLPIIKEMRIAIAFKKDAITHQSHSSDKCEQYCALFFGLVSVQTTIFPETRRPQSATGGRRLYSNPGCFRRQMHLLRPEQLVLLSPSSVVDSFVTVTFLQPLVQMYKSS
ncbi:unnamed protein product [Arctia plantaginis]|uniref:Uncharacterized protein n=1 Tax=Arctia plantaginis TaxID=874455 RepID=A0A8S1BQ57_ARCPL|nr:unnamed protein product [Arctia plantaginis]